MALKKLLEGWERILQEYQAYPHKDRNGNFTYAAALAAKAMSWSASFDRQYHADPLLTKVHYDFGLLEEQHGLKAKKLWKMQAKRIKKIRRRYNIK